MPNSEILLRGILGPIRPDIRPLAYAVDITGQLLFELHFSMDDILVTKHIYPDVAKLLNKNPTAIAKSVERLTRLCWDALGEQELILFYLGRAEKQIPTPRDFLTYLAFYSYLGISYFDAIERYPHLLFQSPSTTWTERHLSTIPVAIQKSIPMPVSQVMAFQSSFEYTTFPVCPACEITMEREYQNYCDRCGQRLDWKNYKYAHTIYPGSPVH